ncbi:MAG: hypothetical protein IJ599_05465, partial [Alphaproteobacteria bacterium]|nr:hypothetical protein [Alphaproteobacteria bacterium]
MVTSKRTSIKGIQKYIEEHHKNSILRYRRFKNVLFNRRFKNVLFNRRFKNVLFNPLLNHDLELPTS